MIEHQPTICILVPVLNEVQNIDELVRRIAPALRNRDYHICFVDDGSRDGTVDRIRYEQKLSDYRIHLIERTKEKRGSQRGSALFAAMMWALESTQCQIIVEMDGDLSHRPDELGTGLAMLDSDVADVVIASKYLAGSQVTNRPIARRLVSTICNFAVRLLISRSISDYSNGYRFYTRAAAQVLAETKIVYASPIYLTEVIGIWMSRGLRVREFPSHYVGRNEGLSKLRFIDLVKAAIAIFEVAYRFHVGGFEKSSYSRSVEMAKALSKKSSLNRSLRE